MTDFTPDPNAVQRIIDLSVMSTDHPAAAAIACIIASVRILERDLMPEGVATIINESVAEALKLNSPAGRA